MGSRKSTQALLPPESVRVRYAELLPPGNALALEVLFALRAGVQEIDNTLSRWLGGDALTPGRWQVLVVLWSAKKALPQREIVDALKVSRPTVSALVETLSDEGHVTLTPDREDKRQVLVALTPDGRRMTARLVKENAERLRQTFRSLDDGELRQLVNLMARLLV